MCKEKMQVGKPVKTLCHGRPTAMKAAKQISRCPSDTSVFPSEHVC